MTCATCVAEEKGVEEHVALRMIKKRDYTTKMMGRITQFQIAQVQVQQVWAFLEGGGEARRPPP
eukprot:2883471-Alexandrium_andersonii.AAC.1